MDRKLWARWKRRSKHSAVFLPECLNSRFAIVKVIHFVIYVSLWTEVTKWHAYVGKHL